MLDLNQIKTEITTSGFTLIPRLISKERCAHFRKLLDADSSKYSPLHAGATANTAHGLQDKSQEKIVYNMHNKHPDYMELLAHPEVLSVAGMMLKDGSYKNSEAFHLINISARSPTKGTKGQQLHLDSNLPGGDFPIIMVVLWMLDDFSIENGATRVIPGSHKRTGYPADGVKYEDEISVTGEAGSVLIYNAALWHGGGEKTVDGSRWAVVLGYGRWFIKPSFDFMQCTPEDVFNRMSDDEKELFGFRSNPPKDEFTRIRRRSETFDNPKPYKLPS